MHGWDVVLVVAAVVSCLAAIAAVTAAVVLSNQVRRLEHVVELLRGDALAVLAEAKAAAGHANSEMARVEAVLEDTESVTATVDRASRLATRAFANPVVKMMAFRAGAARGVEQWRRPEHDARRGRR